MSSTYWCYRCSRFVRVSNPNYVACHDCSSGFIEEVETPTRSSLSDSRRRRFLAAAMYMMRTPESGPTLGLGPGSGSSLRLRRSRKTGGDRSLFNPIIVLCGANDGGGGGGGGAGAGAATTAREGLNCIINGGTDLGIRWEVRRSWRRQSEFAEGTSFAELCSVVKKSTIGRQ